MTNCENCEKEHDGNYGSGRFCSSSCSRSFATKSKRAEINAKVSIALTRPKRLISCKHCGNTFEQQRKRVFCSISCSQSHNWQIDAYRENMQSKINAKAALGQWGGWKIRNVEPSYAEKYFIAVLDNLNIIYEREKFESGYFIDFAIASKKIALEIDGSQHYLHENRIESDKQKDKVLSDLGWKVFRIRWFSPNTKKGSEKLKEQINWFERFYNLRRVS